ncbi:MAG TPA: hypothetical protein VIK91_21740 [Nannocystis sp.]
MSAPAPRLARAFLTATSELGMASTAFLFAREIAKSGDAALAEARDLLGREFPVFHCVAGRWLTGARDPAPDIEPVLAALAGLARLLVVGLETTWLDLLLPRLGGVEVGILREDTGLHGDFRRVLANYEGLAVGVELADMSRWSGRRSGLLTFVYGSDGHVAHVPAAWQRVSGPDVRTQFAALVGWNILGAPMDLYPRWLTETGVADFSHLVGS